MITINTTKMKQNILLDNVSNYLKNGSFLHFLCKYLKNPENKLNLWNNIYVDFKLRLIDNYGLVMKIDSPTHSMINYDAYEFYQGNLLNSNANIDKKYCKDKNIVNEYAECFTYNYLNSEIVFFLNLPYFLMLKGLEKSFTFKNYDVDYNFSKYVNFKFFSNIINYTMNFIEKVTKEKVKLNYYYGNFVFRMSDVDSYVDLLEVFAEHAVDVDINMIKSDKKYNKDNVIYHLDSSTDFNNLFEKTLGYNFFLSSKRFFIVLDCKSFATIICFDIFDNDEDLNKVEIENMRYTIDKKVIPANINLKSSSVFFYEKKDKPKNIFCIIKFFFNFIRKKLEKNIL